MRGFNLSEWAITHRSFVWYLMLLFVVFAPLIAALLILVGAPARVTALLGSAVGLRRDPPAALFGIAAAALLLLFVGIHNAWDTVTYIVVLRWEEKHPRDQEPS